jgi:hypothetical protein
MMFKKYKCLSSSSVIVITSYKKIDHLFKNFRLVTCVDIRYTSVSQTCGSWADLWWVAKSF